MKWVNYTKLFLSENVNEYSFNKTADAIQYVSFAAALNKLNEIWNAENESHFAKQSATEEKTNIDNFADLLAAVPTSICHTP